MTLDYLLMLEALMPADDERDPPTHESHEAIDWFARLQADDVTPEDRRRFEQWLQQRPGHARAFEQATALWAALDEPSRAAYQQLNPVVQQASHARLPAAIPGPPHPSARTLSLRRWRMGSAAAAVAVCVVCLTLWLPGMVRIWNSAYHTDWGERRTVVLEDGSTVLLNTHSALAVKFSPQHREATLVDGEAFFEVAANPDRPFVVLTDQGRTQVVGTRFSVAR